MVGEKFHVLWVTRSAPHPSVLAVAPIIGSTDVTPDRTICSILIREVIAIAGGEGQLPTSQPVLAALA